MRYCRTMTSPMGVLLIWLGPLVFILMTGIGGQGAPPGWKEAVEKDSMLGIEGRHKERIAGLQGWVKRYPDFPDAHGRLGGAYESLGRDLLARRPTPDLDGGLKHLDLAISHFRRSLELGGGRDRDITIRALADLYILLRRPADRTAFVQDAVERFPNEPRAHVEVLRVMIEPGKLDEAHAALASALKAVPRTAEARHALVEGIWLDLAALPDSASWTRFTAQAGAVLDEALTIDPKHQYSLMQKEDVLREQAKRAKDPGRAKALLVEADRVRARWRDRQ